MPQQLTQQCCTSSRAQKEDCAGFWEPLAGIWLFETCPTLSTTCGLFLVTAQVHVLWHGLWRVLFMSFLRTTLFNQERAFLPSSFQKLHSLPLTVLHFLSIWLQMHIPRRAGWGETEQPCAYQGLKQSREFHIRTGQSFLLGNWSSQYQQWIGVWPLMLQPGEAEASMLWFHQKAKAGNSHLSGLLKDPLPHLHTKQTHDLKAVFENDWNKTAFV